MPSPHSGILLAASSRATGFRPHVQIWQPAPPGNGTGQRPRWVVPAHISQTQTVRSPLSPPGATTQAR
jgi:hypothetical protein